MISVNGSGWGPIKAQLESCDFDVLLGQEHKRTAADFNESMQQARVLGWKIAGVAAIKKIEGMSGGTLVAARSWLPFGRALRQGQEVVWPARVSAGWVDT